MQTKSTETGVRVATTIQFPVHEGFTAMCRTIGLDFNTGMKMAILHSLTLHQQNKMPFGSLPVPSYSEGRRALSVCLRRGLPQNSFDIFYANSETSKKVSIETQIRFLDDGISAGWTYRDGSTNQKLCFRLLWAINQLEQTELGQTELGQTELAPSTVLPQTTPSEWMRLANEATLLYP